jgi:two-component system response regulator ResD
MLKILLVEDEEILRDAYKSVLLSEGLEVHVAHNGLDALEKCRHTQYNVILLDLMMPELDGIGFLQQANLKQSSPNTKVIVFSNLSSGQIITKAFELGANSYVLKSDLSPKELIMVINKVSSRPENNNSFYRSNLQKQR